jgi:hypothetical protein
MVDIMSEKTVRTTVMIYESDKSILEELSKLTGESISVLVREMLRNAAPALKSTMEAIVDARTNEEKALRSLSNLIVKAESDARQMHIDCEIVRRERKAKKRGKKAAK